MSTTNPSAQVVLADMEALWPSFVNCRVHFPYVDEGVIGKKCVPTAPYYIARGFRIAFVFSTPVSKAAVTRINEVGHWINQNFVIRLYALLDCHHLTESIDQAVDGWKDVDLVRRLRNYFAHGSGKYDRANKDHQRTMQELATHLGVDFSSESDFPLSINTVLEPLFKGCKKYVKGRLAIPGIRGQP